MKAKMMTQVVQEKFTFPVQYAEGVLNLHGYMFRPAEQTEARAALPPVVFNSGFTGGVSMYGQLFGHELAKLGYNVTTYDVTGFFTNKDIRNSFKSGDITVTNVSLEDQTTELLALIEWTRMNLGASPAVASWAMGSVATLAAVNELARAGGEQIAYFFPMNYTRLEALQGLRANPAETDAAIRALADDVAIPPFDTGNEVTRLGFYPLDPETQAYVDVQLGDYTEAGGADRWPGCTHVTAKSYTSYLRFDPEADLGNIDGTYPPVLVIHGAENTLHMPSESIRLHDAYPGEKGEAALILEGLQHGQQNSPENPVFQTMIANIDSSICAKFA